MFQKIFSALIVSFLLSNMALAATDNAPFTPLMDTKALFSKQPKGWTRMPNDPNLNYEYNKNDVYAIVGKRDDGIILVMTRFLDEDAGKKKPDFTAYAINCKRRADSPFVLVNTAKILDSLLQEPGIEMWLPVPEDSIMDDVLSLVCPK